MAEQDGEPETGGQGESEKPPPDSETKTPTVDELTTAKVELDHWREMAKKNEKLAKANHSELEKLRQSSMSEQDRAIADAVKAAKADTLREVGARLVDAEVRAACASRRLDPDALLDGLDRNRFLTDEHEPDRKAIEDYLDRLAPKDRSQLDLGQGARELSDGNGPDMNALIRKAAGRT
jgi:hypothetical protein